MITITVGTLICVSTFKLCMGIAGTYSKNDCVGTNSTDMTNHMSIITLNNFCSHKSYH